MFFGHLNDLNLSNQSPAVTVINVGKKKTTISFSQATTLKLPFEGG